MKKITLILALTIMLFMFTIFVNADINNTTTAMIANNTVLLTVNGDQCGTMVQDGKFVQRLQENADNNMTVKSFIAKTYTLDDKSGLNDATEDAYIYESSRKYSEFTMIQDDESIKSITGNGQSYAYTDNDIQLNNSDNVQLNSSENNIEVTMSRDEKGALILGAPKIPNSGVYFLSMNNNVLDNTMVRKLKVAYNLRGSVLKTITSENLNFDTDGYAMLMEDNIVIVTVSGSNESCNDTTLEDNIVVVAVSGSSFNRNTTNGRVVVT